MANKRRLKDSRDRARRTQRLQKRYGDMMRRAQGGNYVQPNETTYLLDQLNQFGQPGHNLRYSANMTPNEAVEMAADGARRMDQINPTRRGSLMQQPQQEQPQPQPQQQQPVSLPPITNEQMSNMFLDLNNDGQVNFGQGNVQGGVPISQPQAQQPQQVQQAPAQGGVSGGIQPPAQSGYGFGPDPNMQANDSIIAAGKQASGVAGIEAATPKIDASQVAETVTPKLAESGTEVATKAAGDAAKAANPNLAAGVGAAGAVADMAGQAIQKNADDTTGKNVAGTTLSGAGKGAAMGATIGSVIPGVGTAIGAGVGALVGATAGFVKGKKTQNEAIGDRRTKEKKKAEELINMRKNATTSVGQNTGFNIGQSTAGSNAYLPGQAASGYAAKYGAYKLGAGGISSQLRAKAAENSAEVLPGGIKMPIGFGVDKFHGNKHDEAGMGSKSGIILEQGGKGKAGLEVEDGEWEVEVNTKDEGLQEYIVSDYIRNPATGNTLAEDLEEAIRNASSKQEAAQIVAKFVRLNEKLKGAEGEPERVDMPRAQLGRRKKAKEAQAQYEQEMADYEQAQIARQEAIEEAARLEAENEAGQKAYEEEVAASEAANAAEQERFDRETEEYNRITAENERLRGEAAGRGAVQEKDAQGNVIYGGDRSANIASWLGAREAEYGKLPEEFRTYDFDQFKNDAGEFDASLFDTQARSGFRDFYNTLPDDLVTGKIAANNDESDLAFGEQWDTRRFLQRAAAPAPVKDVQTVEPKEFVKKDIPGLPEVGPAPVAPPQRVGGRFTGTTLQAAGPIAALNKNFTPETIATPYEKERILGRVNMNQDRARADAATTGASKAISTSVAGPAALAMQQANLSRGAGQQDKITAAEDKTNVGIANQETQVNTGVAARNARNFANTQAFNARSKQRANEMNINKDIDAVNQLGKIATQTVKDYNQQFADRFEAQANQVDGEFDRALLNYYKSNMPFGIGGTDAYAAGGTTYSPDQIQAENEARATAKVEEEEASAKKGGYFRKTGKVRRRRRKRK